MKIDPIIRKFLQQRYTLGVVLMVIFALGLWSMMTMPKDLMPKVEFSQVLVSGQLPGVTAVGVECQVLYLLEPRLQSLSGVEELQSTATPGAFQITVFSAQPAAQMINLVNRVNSEIESLKSQLPSGLRGLTVRAKEINSVFFAAMALKGFSSDDDQAVATYQEFKKQALALPGVVEVASEYKKPEIHIEFDMKALSRWELSIPKARARILDQLQDKPIGYFQKELKKTFFRIGDTVLTPTAIAELAIGGNQLGQTLRVKDIARVSYKASPVSKKTYFDGKPALLFVVKKDLEADAAVLDKSLSQLIARSNKEKKLEFVSYLKVNEFLDNQMQSLKYNGWTGILFVLAILFLFLDLKVAIVAMCSLPLTYMASFAVLGPMGLKFDLITTIGFLLVFGIVVDDTILLSEHFLKKLKARGNAPDAAIETVKELFLPVLGTLVTTLIVFVPLATLTDHLGQLIAAIPVIIITSMTLSFVDTFFVLPSHLVHAFENKLKPKSSLAKRINQQIEKSYRRSLAWSIRFRYPVFLLCLCVPIVAVWIFQSKLAKNFDLGVNPKMVSVTIEFAEKFSLLDADRAIQPISDTLKNTIHKHSEHFTLSVGAIDQFGKKARDFQKARLDIFISPTHLFPSQVVSKLKSDLEADLSQVSKQQELGVKTAKVHIVQAGNSKVSAPVISVNVLEEETGRVKAFKEQVMDEFQGSSYFSQVIPPSLNQVDLLRFDPDPAALTFHGLTQDEIATNIWNYTSAQELFQYSDRIERSTISTSIAGINNLEQLKDLTLVSPKGQTLSLSSLGRWVSEVTESRVLRKNGVRSHSFQFVVDPKVTNASHAKTAIEKFLMSKGRDIKAQVFVGDRVERTVAKSLKEKSLFSVAAILVFMTLLFQSSRLALLCLVPVVFAQCCGLVALYLAGQALTPLALIGMLGTLGIAVNGAIVWVSEWSKQAKQSNWAKSIYQTSTTRFRSIFVSNLTTLVGVGPLAYSLSGESELTEPLAFTLFWGLLSCAAFLLYGLPAMLIVFRDIQVTLKAKMSLKPSADIFVFKTKQSVGH